jgi:tetratricopeptide (TPR) repeat protein
MKNILKVIIAVALIFMGTSCNNDEFFELINPPQAPFQTMADLENGVIGAYYTLTGNGGFRAIFDCGRIIGEVYADGVLLAEEAAGYPVDSDTQDMYNRATAGTQVALYDNSMFNSGYFAVGHANGGLDFIIDNDFNPFPLDTDANKPENVNRLAGEFYFVRAYAYYWIARSYLPTYPNDEERVPFRLNQAGNFDEAVTSDLGSATEVYEQVVADLREAKSLLPERFESGVHHPSYADGRANKFAASALLAKVLFHMRRYDEALAELNFVIDQNGGDYDLSEEPIEAFNKTGPIRGKEVIWYYTLWGGDGLGGSSNWKHPGRLSWYNASNRDNTDPSPTGGNPANNGGRFLAASDSFLEAVGWQDANGDETAEALQDLRYVQLFKRFTPKGSGVGVEEPRENFNPNRSYVWGDKYYRSGVRRSTNVVILRLADMYLLRSVIRATYSNVDETAALADLNVVRERAGLDPLAGLTGADLVNAIHNERWVEMAFEGDRLFYLQGNEVDIPNGDRGDGSVPWNSNFYSELPDYEIDFNQAYSN